MSHETLSAELIKAVAEKLNISAENVTLQSEFQKDLGADSLDIVELLMSIEEKFGVKISDSEAEQMKTVEDALTFIKNNKK